MKTRADPDPFPATSRREFLSALAALLSAAGTRPGFASGAASSGAAVTPGSPDETARLDALFSTILEEQFARSPQQLTALGLDTGRYAWAKWQLDRVSQGALDEARRQSAAQHARLEAFGRPAQAGADRANFDTVAYALDLVVRTGRFAYGDLEAQPYVVSQLTGAYQSIPTFLAERHRIENREDADAYLARLRAFARVLDEETARLQHDSGLGVVPPDFIIDAALVQMRDLRGVPPRDSTLVTSIARRARAHGISGDYGAAAARIVAREVYPALDRQAAALGRLRGAAVHEAGIGRLPDGAAYYAMALRYQTTTELTPEEVHRFGLEQVAALVASAEAQLKAQGMTSGSIGERFQALAADPRYLYPGTDAGRQALLDYCKERLAALQPHLPRYFRVLPKAAVEIHPVPRYIEAGAPGGYYENPSIDGSRPGIFFINLRDTSELSRWKLPTFIYHETEPGHHFQLALLLEMAALPLIRKANDNFNANVEGWALYAERLCGEMGLYEDDPSGGLGLTQSLLFRAARCVVDTGLHAMGWSRERAIDYMLATTGEIRSVIVSEVERYCVWPGQATGYMVGEAEWLRLREEAQRRLGARFDIRDFHDVGLTAGPMPLAVLERVVVDWLDGLGA